MADEYLDGPNTNGITAQEGRKVALSQAVEVLRNARG